MIFSLLFQFYGYGRFGPFSQALAWMEQFGLLDSIIPFALIFAVSYQILKQTNVLQNERVNAVVALSISLVTVIPHVLGIYPSPFADPVTIINRSLPEFALIMIAIVLVLVLANLLGFDATSDGTVQKVAPWAALVLVGLVLFGALTAPGTLPGFLSFLAEPVFYTLMIIILVFGLIIYAVVGSS